MTVKGVQRLETALGALAAPFVPIVQTMEVKIPSRSRFFGGTKSTSTNSGSMIDDIDPDLLSTAEEVVMNARRKQAILVWILVQLQTHCRVWLAKRFAQRLRLGDPDAIKKAMKDRKTAEKEAYERRLAAEREAARKLAEENERRRRSKAAILVQSVARGFTARHHLAAVRYVAIWSSKVFRGRRVRLAYQLVLFAVSCVQAVARGRIVHRKFKKVVQKRSLLYRQYIFYLWQQAHTPISYRTKFWLLTQEPRFLCLKLDNSEIRRLWAELKIDDTIETIDGGTTGLADDFMHLASSIGLSSDFYFTVKKVRTSRMPLIALYTRLLIYLHFSNSAHDRSTQPRNTGRVPREPRNGGTTPGL